MVAWRRSEPGLLVALMFAGAALRAWAVVRGNYYRSPEGEMYNIAVSFAKTGNLAGAFSETSGPTAHVMPLPPIVAGSILRMFNEHAIAAEMLLAILAMGTIATTWALFYKTFTITGMDRDWALRAVAFLAIIPVYFYAEAVEFRTWEGAQAALILAAGLCLLAIAEDRNRMTARVSATLIAVIAVGLAISPIISAGLAACLGLFFIRRGRFQAAAGAAVATACAAAAVLTPWTIRNEVRLNHPVVLRSNLGLVLASAYNGAAADAAFSPNRESKFPRYLAVINPFGTSRAYQAMVRLGGEVRYNALLERRALGWMDANPRETALLALRYGLDFLFTPHAIWTFYTPQTVQTRFSAAVSGLVSVLGLTGLWFAFRRGQAMALYAATVIAMTTAFYMLSQPLPRYHYLIYALLVFLAFQGFQWLAGRSHAGSGAARAGQDRPAA